MGGGGWVVGWSEDWRVMLNSTQDQIKLKLKFELSLAIFTDEIGDLAESITHVRRMTRGRYDGVS